MTEKDIPVSRYHGNFTYEGVDKDEDFIMLAFYLRGKPDTQRWRDAFANNEVILIEHKGKIIPQWAILDARQLLEEGSSDLLEALEKYELSVEDIPPLI